MNQVHFPKQPIFEGSERSLSYFQPGRVTHFLVAQGCRGPERRGRPQAAQAPGFGGVGRLQRAPHHGAGEGGTVGGRVRQGVVGGRHRHGPPFSVPRGREGVGRELR